MDFEPSSLIASLVVSSIGFVVFAYGKRQQRVPQVVVGFPYLVPSVAIMGAIAGVLLIGLWLAIRFGL
jgi:hypothetical protein